MKHVITSQGQEPGHPIQHQTTTSRGPLTNPSCLMTCTRCVTRLTWVWDLSGRKLLSTQTALPPAGTGPCTCPATFPYPFQGWCFVSQQGALAAAAAVGKAMSFLRTAPSVTLACTLTTHRENPVALPGLHGCTGTGTVMKASARAMPRCGTLQKSNGV